MNTSFRVSLLCLLLLIPQHGNSPLPVMETWLQKDQDDGIVQRDMTSSLTGGDESFGTAHQTYQNSLIRKKKDDNSENLLPSVGYRKFASNYDRGQMQSNSFFDGRYVNEDYSQPAVDNPKSSAIFENFDTIAGLPTGNRMQYKTATLRMDKPSADLEPNLPYQEEPTFADTRLNYRSGNTDSMNQGSYEYDNTPGWAMCKKMEDTPADFLNMPPSSDMQDILNMPLSGIGNDIKSHDLRIQELRDSSRPEGKSFQSIDEKEYYDSASPGEDDDYGQMLNSHAYIQKRDGAKQATRPNERNPAEAGKALLDPLRYSERIGGYNEKSALFDAERDSNMDSDPVDVNIRSISQNIPEENFIWKLGSEAQSQALSNILENSQAALKEVQNLQRKAHLKSENNNDNDDIKRESRNPPKKKFGMVNIDLDEKRLKREDEDEQKNMKTGTDEGGGGEYEDEEGKGHKDEEEYYEDADLSEDDSGSDVRPNEEDTDRYVKREVLEDKPQNTKSKETEEKSEDYELSLENAPIENSKKSRKTSYREGEKTKNNSVRKGVKIWDEWGKWSPCSVTCGVGRSTRWRHCIGGGCAQGEKEAQIKKCTNPAC